MLGGKFRVNNPNLINTRNTELQEKLKIDNISFYRNLKMLKESFKKSNLKLKVNNKHSPSF